MPADTASTVTAALAAEVAPGGGEVIALGLSAATTAIAEQRHDGSPVRYTTGDAAALDLPANMHGRLTRRQLDMGRTLCRRAMAAGLADVEATPVFATPESAA